MNIKKIIKEELEGFKDSSQEDWNVFNNDIEWTEELLMGFLEHKAIEFKAVDEDDDYRLELDKDYDSGYTFIVSWSVKDNMTHLATGRDWTGYSLEQALNGLNTSWTIMNM